METVNEANEAPDGRSGAFLDYGYGRLILISSNKTFQ